MTTRDLYPVHRWIADHFFEGQGWVYNGAATDATFSGGITGKVYVCRARDMRVGHYGQSYVAVQRYDDKWNALTRPRLLPIITADNEVMKMDTGPQDARVFIFKGHVWAVFNMLCKDGFRRMHLYNITGLGNAIPLRIDGKDRSRTEKNWTPFVFNNKLFFIYYFQPLVILQLEVETGRCSVVFSSEEPRRGELRGGSPALQSAGGDPTRFVGYLHTTVAIDARQREDFDVNELPTPAKATAHVYRVRRFEMIFGRAQQRPSLKVDDELTFEGKQIEQVYGLGLDGWGILNVNDRQTVILERLSHASRRT